MHTEVEEIIEMTIGLPLAMRVLESDKKKFDGLYSERVHVAYIEALIEEMKQFFIQVKEQLFKEHHIIVYKQGEYQYIWRSGKEKGILAYDSNQLKNITEKTMNYCFTQLNVKEFSFDEVPWKYPKLPIPDIELLDEDE